MQTKCVLMQLVLGVTSYIFILFDLWHKLNAVELVVLWKWGGSGSSSKNNCFHF